MSPSGKQSQHTRQTFLNLVFSHVSGGNFLQEGVHDQATAAHQPHHTQLELPGVDSRWLSPLTRVLQEFSWLRSKTEGVRRYKFKIRRQDEDRASDFIIGKAILSYLYLHIAIIFPSDDNTIQEESFEEGGRTQTPLTFKAGFMLQLLSHPINTVQSGFVDDEIRIF